LQGLLAHIGVDDGDILAAIEALAAKYLLGDRVETVELGYYLAFLGLHSHLTRL
jgi:hypothetical protein